MAWQSFYCALVWMTLFYAHIPIQPLYRRNHVFGAEIILVGWLTSWAARELTGDLSPIELNAAIDIIVGTTFLLIARIKQAVWSATCAILHGLMLVLHFAYSLSGQIAEGTYIWILNALFLGTIIATNIAIAAGRNEWGERIDQFFMARIRGWTWSGVSLPRRRYN